MDRTLEQFVGNTPLVRLQRIPGKTTNVVLAKLEGNNPAGSVKDRPAVYITSVGETRSKTNQFILPPAPRRRRARAQFKAAALQSLRRNPHADSPVRWR